MIRPTLAVVLVAVTLPYAADVRASGGAVDVSFGSNGRVLTAFLGAAAAGAAAVGPDGTLVVAGDGAGEFAALVRYRRDGSLDPTFGSGGRVLTAFQGARGVRAVVVQADGKAVVVGEGEDEFAALVRYRQDGSLDPTFGSGGRVLTAFQGARGVRAVVVQADGKVVVVGEGEDEFAALVRYRQDGNLDPTFGSGGRVLTAFQGAGRVRAAVAQADGTLVVVGDAEQEFAALVRYRDDGRLDATFGSGGRVLTPFQGARAARAAVAQADGTLVVVGDAEQEFAALVRYRRDGSLDPTFGSGGRVLSEFPGAHAPQAAVAQGGGKVVVVGDGGPGEFAALVRYANETTMTTRPPTPATSTSGITSPGTSPIGCPGGTSPAAIQCRADALVTAAGTGLPAGSLHDSVMAMVTAARARAAGVAMQRSPREVRAALRTGRRLLARAHARLRARRRALPARARDELLGRLEALRADLATLSRSL